MSNEVLGLKITGSLNYGLSLDQINRDLRILSKHPSLQKLKINISIDENFIKNLSSFSKNLNVITQQLNQQNSANDKLNNGLNNTTQSIQNQVRATNEAIAAEKKWQTEREKTNSKGVKTTTYGNNQDNSKQVVTTLSDGSIKNIDNIQNQIKDMKQLQSLVEQMAQGRVASETKVRDFERQWNESQQRAIQSNAEIERAEIGKTQQTRKSYEDWYLKAVREREIQDSKTYTNLNNKLTNSRSASMTGVESTKALDLLNRKYGEVAQRITSLQSSGRQLTESEISGINRRIQALNGLASRQMQVEKELSTIQNKASQKVSTSNAGETDIKRMKELLAQLKAINTSVPDFQRKSKALSDEINRIGREAAKTSSSTRTLGSSLKMAFTNMLMYSGLGSVFYGVTNSIKSGLRYVYELDTAMTNLAKVTDETTSTYNRFVGTAHNTANSIGGVTLDVIKATTEWARLGYTMQQAQSLAKETLIYQNVGDIGSAEEASRSLISTMKGFGLEVDKEGKNITHIVDVFNEVGNRFAISSAGIGESLRRSSASMFEAGNTLEQTVALTTAANSVIQDPARVGQALKTVSMRLRGVSEEGEDLNNLVPKLEEKFSSLGLTLKKDDQTFKSTYEILESLSSIWGEISDFQRAEILELTAGKLQGNIVGSLLSNFGDAQKSLNSALNSTGSAARENEKYINSISGRLNLLKNSVVDFWTSSIDSGFVKGVIDLVTSLVGHLGNLGNTLGIVGVAFILLKSKAIAGLYASLYSTIGALVATTYAAGAAATAMTLLGKSFTLGWIGLAAGALYILYDVIKGSDKVIEKQNELIEQTNEKYDKLGSKLNEVSGYYKENFDVISTNTDVKSKLFEMQNDLIDSFGLEAKGIDLVNGKYDEQITKIENLKKSALDSQIKESQIMVDAANERNNKGTPLLGSNGFGGYKIASGDDKSLTNLQYYEELEKRYKEIQDSSEKAFASQKLFPKNAIEWENALNEVTDEMEKYKPIYNEEISLIDKKKERLKQTTLEQVKLTDEQKTLFDSISSITNQQPLEDLNKNFSGIAGYVSWFNGGNLDEVVNNIKRIEQIKGNPEIVASLDQFAKNSAEAALKAKETSTEVVTLLDAMKALDSTMNGSSSQMTAFVKSVSDSSDEIELLTSAQNELKKSNTLSASTIAEMNEKYGDFIKVTGLSKEKVLEFIQSKKDEKIAVVNAEIAMTKQAIDGAKKRIEAMEIEVAAINKKRKALAQERIDALNAGVADGTISESLAEKQVAAILRNGDDAVLDLSVEKSGLDALSAKLSILTSVKEEFISVSNKTDDNKKSTDDLTKANKDNYDSVSDTVEILTDLQKALLNVDKAQKKLQNSQDRLKEGSKERQESINKEISLLKEQKRLYEEGIKDPSKLVSTKVTTTVKTKASDDSSSSSTDSSSSSSVSNMLSNALGLQGKFNYKQVSGKFQGTYEEFVKGATSDCSQFVQEMFDEFLNVKVPRTAAEQAKQGVSVSKADLQEGDLVFFNTTGKDNSHVGIYSGNGKFVQMGDSGLKESSIDSSYWADKYQGARRITSDSSSPSSSNGVSASKVGSTTVKTDGATDKEKSDAKAAAEATVVTLDSQIYSAYIKSLDNTKAGFEQLITEQENRIEASKKKQETLDPNSVEWRSENNKQINAQSDIQSIKHDEKNQLSWMMEKLGVESADYDAFLAKLSVDWTDIQADKVSKVAENLTSQLNNYDSQISDLGSTIDISNAKLENMTVGSAEYRKEILSQIPILKKQQDLRLEEKALVESQLKNEKLTIVSKNELSDRLQQLELDWISNEKAIRNVTDAILALTSELTTSLFDSLSSSLNSEDIINLNEFSDSIDSIISSLDSIDGKYLNGVNFVDSSASTRSDLSDYSSKVKDIANQVKSALTYYQDMSTVSFGNMSNLGNQITSQINLIANLKTQLESINNTIRDTELQYSREEASLENLIKTQEKSYDTQIKNQQDILDGLDDQIEKEDRIKTLQEKNDELNKVKNDKRFEYVTEVGELILTYDKAKVDELEKQKDDLVKQYEREDVKSAIQSEIDRLEKDKTDTVTILQEKLDKTKEIHAQNLEAMRLYQTNLSSLYDKTVQDTQDKMTQFQEALEKGYEDGTITIEEKSKLLELVVDGWQASSLTKWDGYIQGVASKLAQLKALYAEVGNLSLSGSTGEAGNAATTSTPQALSRDALQQAYDLKNPNSTAEQKAITDSNRAKVDTIADIFNNNTKDKTWNGSAWVPRYHTGGTAGEKPLAHNELPAILKLGEDIFTEEHKAKIKQLFMAPVDFIKTMASDFQRNINNISFPSSSPAVGGGTSYTFSGPITVKANNPTEFFQGLERHINSNKK